MDQRIMPDLDAMAGCPGMNARQVMNSTKNRDAQIQLRNAFDWAAQVAAVEYPERKAMLGKCIRPILGGAGRRSDLEIGQELQRALIKLRAKMNETVVENLPASLRDQIAARSSPRNDDPSELLMTAFGMTPMADAFSKPARFFEAYRDFMLGYKFLAIGAKRDWWHRGPTGTDRKRFVSALVERGALKEVSEKVKITSFHHSKPELEDEFACRGVDFFMSEEDIGEYNLLADKQLLIRRDRMFYPVIISAADSEGRLRTVRALCESRRKEEFRILSRMFMNGHVQPITVPDIFGLRFCFNDVADLITASEWFFTKLGIEVSDVVDRVQKQGHRDLNRNAASSILMRKFSCILRGYPVEIQFVLVKQRMDFCFSEDLKQGRGVNDRLYHAREYAAEGGIFERWFPTSLFGVKWREVMDVINDRVLEVIVQERKIPSRSTPWEF